MIVIFDLDGTLALIDHRRPLVECDRKHQDWDAFYKACVDDIPNLPVIEMFKTLRERGHKCYIFSGRSDLVKDETIDWLLKNNIVYERLFMRPEGDYTPDDELKMKWIGMFSNNGFKDILCVFDDRDKVVKMWRDMGITCFQVAPGDF